MRIHAKAGLALLVAIGAAAVPSWTASAAADSFTVYPVWCGHWNPNPGSAPAAETHTSMPDNSVADIAWGTIGGKMYVWARLTNAPTDDRIALAWKDDLNQAMYQCGDSHNYSTATVWPGTTVTWTAGVPLTPPSAGDATAQCVELLVWRYNGVLEYPTKSQCITPWLNGTNGAPPSSAPSSPASPAPPAPGAIRVRLSLHGSRRSLRNGQVLQLRGRVLGTAIPVGLLVELQARVAPRQWITFGVAITRPGGRYSYGYRFTRTTGRQTYWLRARLPTESAYSSYPAISGPIRVRVAGPS